MPGGFPLGLDICNPQNVGIVAANSTGLLLTSGLANTMGTYTQLIASTTSDACFIVVIIDTFPSTSPQVAADIAIGAGGSEKIICSQLLTNELGFWYTFPCNIPSGTRIAARIQSATASDTTDVSLLLFDGAFTQIEGAAGVDSIGFVAASTQGTTIDPGAVGNTKGAYAQLVASSSRDYMGFMICCDTLNATPGTNTKYLLDVAVGAAGSEVVILSNLQGFRILTNVTAYPGGAAFYPISIPAGSRIAVRAQANNTATPARTFGITLYGVYQ